MTRATKPALAGATISGCFSYLIDTGDFKGFIDCMTCKFTVC
jgi:hypothetical protein